jgi:hypothetical protein
MNMKSDPNMLLAWVWILLGFIVGMVQGLFFHNEHWLGGYTSFRRRMYRLGHVAFFALGAVNLLFALTRNLVLPSGTLPTVASKAFLIGALTMPICCFLLPHYPRARALFAVPILNLITGAVLVLIDLSNL